MHKLTYPKDREAFEREYVEIITKCSGGSLECAWRRLHEQYPAISLFTKDVKDILTAPFEELVEICEDFCSGAISDRLKMDLTRLFAYDQSKRNMKSGRMYAGVIRDFFRRHSSEMNLDTCPYCELSYIQMVHVRNRGKDYQLYDLDHFISKKLCPVTALSLYNLVPSCPTCNRSLKHRRWPYDEIGSEALKKVSPSSQYYSFDNGVKMFYVPEVDGHTAYVGFDVREQVYENTVELFALRERYSFHADIAGSLIERRRIFSDAYIEMIADMFLHNGVFKTPEMVKAEIFGTALHKDDHHLMSKLHHDLLPDVYGTE